MAELGFQINTHKHTVSTATLKKFAKFAVANISDVMNRTMVRLICVLFTKAAKSWVVPLPLKPHLAII